MRSTLPTRYIHDVDSAGATDHATAKVPTRRQRTRMAPAPGQEHIAAMPSGSQLRRRLRRRSVPVRFASSVLDTIALQRRSWAARRAAARQAEAPYRRFRPNTGPGTPAICVQDCIPLPPKPKRLNFERRRPISAPSSAVPVGPNSDLSDRRRPGALAPPKFDEEPNKKGGLGGRPSPVRALSRGIVRSQRRTNPVSRGAAHVQAARAVS